MREESPPPCSPDWAGGVPAPGALSAATIVEGGVPREPLTFYFDAPFLRALNNKRRPWRVNCLPRLQRHWHRFRRPVAYHLWVALAPDPFFCRIY